MYELMRGSMMGSATAEVGPGHKFRPMYDMLCVGAVGRYDIGYPATSPPLRYDLDRAFKLWIGVFILRMIRLANANRIIPDLKALPRLYLKPLRGPPAEEPDLGRFI